MWRNYFTVAWWNLVRGKVYAMIFAAAGGGAMVLTLLTVSYHTIRAALTNPTQSLRSE